MPDAGGGPFAWSWCEWAAAEAKGYTRCLLEDGHAGPHHVALCVRGAATIYRVDEARRSLRTVMHTDWRGRTTPTRAEAAAAFAMTRRV